MDISDITKLEIDDGEYLCTYKTKTFFVKRTPKGMDPGWIISEEQKNGSLKAIEGVHNTLEDAVAYYKEMHVRGKKRATRISKRKGGIVLPKDWGWAEGDRLVADINGRFYIGTVTSIRGYSNNMFVKFDSGILDDNGYPTWELNKDDPRIVGRGVDKINKNLIPANRISLWLKEDVVKRREPYPYILLPDLQRELIDTSPEEIKLLYMHFLNSLKKNIKIKTFARIVDEYLSTHIVSFYKGLEGTYLGTTEGIYWNQRNEVSLKWGHIENADVPAALAVLHEVIHYKLWPVRTQLKNFLKKNVGEILSLDIDDPPIEKWLKLFIMENKKLDVKRIRHLFKYTEWETRDFDILYGLTHFYEFPSVVFSIIGTNWPASCEEYEKAYRVLFAKFKKQILK